MRKSTSFFVVVLLLPLFLFAEKRPKNKMKFGKIPIEEFQIKSTPLDTTADAIILGDFHNYSMEIYSNGLKTNIKIYRRVLILDPEGAKDLETIQISLYQGNTGEDKLARFKASTYNLEDGKIVETKLDKDSRFKEESEKWDVYKFAFSNVKKGSILEYTYTISSDFFEFPTYYPQQEYPVLWSELDLQYIDGINFKYNYTGNTAPFYRNSETLAERHSDTWIFKDVEPLKQDNYMGPVINYQTKINYELNSIEIPGVLYRNYTTSWQEIAKDYMEKDHAGKLISKARYFKDIVAYVNADTEAITDEAKVTSALGYIRANYLWTGRNTEYPSYNFNDVLKDKKGNSADLNMLLMGSLTSMGIPVKPVLLSTRNNGWLLKTNPSTDDLNYVITSFIVDGKRHFVDAATSYSGIDALPAKCLNGEALIADIQYANWIELSPNMKYHRRVFVQAEITEDLEVKGVCQTKEIDYAAQYVRNKIKKEGGLEDYIEHQKKGIDDFEITNYEINNLDKTSQEVSIKFEFTSENIIEELGELLAINPILFRDFDENPFKKDHREFAIDFTYPITLEYTYIIKIPEGFAFDELPKPTRVSNADKSIDLILNASATGQSANITLKLQIKKSMYIVNQYDDIKTFFDYFISQQNRPLLLIEL